MLAAETPPIPLIRSGSSSIIHFILTQFLIVTVCDLVKLKVVFSFALLISNDPYLPIVYEI